MTRRLLSLLWLATVALLAPEARAFGPDVLSPDASDVAAPAPDGGADLSPTPASPSLGELLAREPAAPAEETAEEAEEEAEEEAPAPSVPPTTETRASAGFQDRLAALASAPVLARARLGAWVARLDDGAVAFSRRGDETLVPASTSKLVTAAAALHHLGPDYRFETAVLLDGATAQDMAGPLYLEGHGDPTLDAGALAFLAQAVAERDLRRVRGGVCADGRAFDDAELAPGFASRETDAAYRPAVAATAVHRATVRVAVYPGATPGSPCRPWFELGSGYLEVVNRCTTTAGKTDKVTLSTERGDGRTRVILGGSLGVAAGRVVATRRIHHPLPQAAHAFSEALRDAGVRVDSPPGRCERPGRRRLLVHRSSPLAAILRDMNKSSDNFIAEMVFKTLGGEVEGWPASWAGASRAVARFLTAVDRELGGAPLFAEGGYVFGNGSGLYDTNRLSAHQLVRVVRYAARHPEWGPDFLASLPIAGRDGTLRRRMAKGPAARRARGKTGTLNGVDALAGLVTDASGTVWVYALLANEVRGPHGEIRRALDAMVEAIAQ